MPRVSAEQVPHRTRARERVNPSASVHAYRRLLALAHRVRRGVARLPGVTNCYSSRVARAEISLSYDEAMAVCLLLAEAADAAVNEEPVRDTWVGEARLMIELILGRTDE